LLEGGSYRGIYTAGVLDVLMKNDIYPNCVVGVSAGSMNGLSYVSRQPGRAKEVILNYGLDSRYMGRKALFHEGGVVGFDFILNTLGKSQEIPFDYETFESSECKYFAAVTNCRTGMQEYIDRDNAEDIYKAVRASCSMPLVCKKVKIGGDEYLDGGVAAKIPLDFLTGHHYDKAVIILTRPLDHFAKPVSTRTKRLCKNVYRRYPQIVYNLANEDILQNNLRGKIKKLEADRRVFVIAPSKPLPIGRMERSYANLEQGYNMGVSDGENRLSALIKYLKD